jgi:hypothetical protein
VLRAVLLRGVEDVLRLLGLARVVHVVPEVGDGEDAVGAFEGLDERFLVVEVALLCVRT